MSFWGSIFGGSNPTLNNDMNSFGNIGGFASGQGQNDTSAASNFYKTLLGGDMGKISQLLAPQIGAMQKQGQQQKMTTAQFGNRGGGTNASMQQVTDRTNANINDMISQLTGGAASNLGNLGSSLLNTGLDAYGQQANASQAQMQNWMNSIFGQGIGGGLSGLEGIGMGMVGKSAGLAGF